MGKSLLFQTPRSHPTPSPLTVAEFDSEILGDLAHFITAKTVLQSLKTEEGT